MVRANVGEMPLLSKTHSFGASKRTVNANNVVGILMAVNNFTPTGTGISTDSPDLPLKLDGNPQNC